MRRIIRFSLIVFFSSAFTIYKNNKKISYLLFPVAHTHTMGDHDPITTPPRRRADQNHHHHPLSARPQHHHQQLHMASGGGDSCKNTPNLSRKIDAYHQHALFDGGSQSAKSSPLPHRRLDKLEGCIRDKPSPLSLRRRLEALDAQSYSTGSGCPCHDLPEPQSQRNATADCGCNNGADIRSPIMVDTYRDSPTLMRRRLDSDCGCASAAAKRPAPTMTMSSPQASRRLAVMGEPGCFNSPIHRPTAARINNNATTSAGFVDTTKSVLGEPGVFASPARSVSSVVSTIGDGADMCTELLDAFTADDSTDAVQQPTADQTVVSGWLKFRDNKRVSVQLEFDVSFAIMYAIWQLYMLCVFVDARALSGNCIQCHHAQGIYGVHLPDLTPEIPVNLCRG